MASWAEAMEDGDDDSEYTHLASDTFGGEVVPVAALSSPAARLLLSVLRPVATTASLVRYAQRTVSSTASEISYFAHLSYAMTRTFVEGVVHHHVAGPPRESWGIGLNLLTKVMRANIFFPKHTMTRIRRPEQLFSPLLPTPLDIRIKSFRFTVNKALLLRAERESATWWGEGVGKERHVVPAEINDSPFYEITGEWVECTSSPGYKARAGSWAAWLAGHEDGGGGDEKAIFYLHGGAYSMLSAASHRSLTSRIARETGMRVCAINYRLAPEHPFPAALHDAFAAFLYLTEPDHPAISPSPAHCFRPENLVFMGDSAGGGLCASLMLYLKDFLRDESGRPRFGLPGGSVLMSPWCDLTCSQPSWSTNAHTDWLPSGLTDIFAPMYAEDGPNPVAGYIWGQKPDPDRRYRAIPSGDPYEMVDVGGWAVERRVLDQVTHPLVSPLYGDLRGLPPVLIQAGDAEILRDETVLFAKKYSAANRHRRGSFAPGMDHEDPVLHGGLHGHVRHELFKDMVHVFQAFLFLHSAQVALQSIGRFTRSLFGEAERFDEDDAVLTVAALEQEGDVMVTVRDMDNEEELADGKTGMEIAREIGDGELEVLREAVAMEGVAMEGADGSADAVADGDEAAPPSAVEGLGIASWLPRGGHGPVTFDFY
ncbi:Alpha/Beta hydrolase protein [Hyaloraphidium curvatum]|nr:Alpha/Beta hydrolase protein [Hyaloraphidium curvatum]